MINAKSTKFLAFFVLFLIPQLASASTKVWSENFDSNSCTKGQACPINQPSLGSAWIQKDVSSYPGDPYGTNYTYASPGRNGTGKYLRGAANVAPFWTWKYNATWPSDEMYVSFYQKFEGYVKTANPENQKIWRPTFMEAGTGKILSIEVSTTVPSGGIVIVYYNSDGIIRDSPHSNLWVSPSVVDGNWRHFEFYVNFKSKILKMWYEGTLVYTNEIKYPGGDTGWAITNHVNWLNAGNIDGTGQGTYTTRSFDDIEYWDGMPSQTKSLILPNLNNEPNAPTNLIVN